MNKSVHAATFQLKKQIIMYQRYKMWDIYLSPVQCEDWRGDNEIL